MAENRDLWVFAYGSLMWRPGFAFAEVAHARLDRLAAAPSASTRAITAARSAAPASCWGSTAAGPARAWRSAWRPPTSPAALRYLREREQIISVYREALVPVTLMTAERPEVMALAFLVERAHPSYAGRLPLAEQAASHPRRRRAARAATSIISSARLRIWPSSASASARWSGS